METWVQVSAATRLVLIGGEGAVECFERVGEMRAGDGRLVVVREEHESTATIGWTVSTRR